MRAPWDIAGKNDALVKKYIEYSHICLVSLIIILQYIYRTLDIRLLNLYLHIYTSFKPEMVLLY